MASEEEMKALQALIKAPERVSPGTIHGLIASAGMPKKYDNQLPCKAFASAVRSPIDGTLAQL